MKALVLRGGLFGKKAGEFQEPSNFLYQIRPSRRKKRFAGGEGEKKFLLIEEKRMHSLLGGGKRFDSSPNALVKKGRAPKNDFLYRECFTRARQPAQLFNLEWLLEGISWGGRGKFILLEEKAIAILGGTKLHLGELFRREKAPFRPRKKDLEKKAARVSRTVLCKKGEKNVQSISRTHRSPSSSRKGKKHMRALKLAGKESAGKATASVCGKLPRIRQERRKYRHEDTAARDGGSIKKLLAPLRSGDIRRGEKQTYTNRAWPGGGVLLREGTWGGRGGKCSHQTSFSPLVGRMG